MQVQYYQPNRKEKTNERATKESRNAFFEVFLSGRLRYKEYDTDEEKDKTRGKQAAMKISGRKSVGGAGPMGQAGKAKEKPQVESQASVQSGAADVNLSEGMREAERARQMTRALPDVRAEKVSELKPVVNDGTYHRESTVIAKKLVDSSLQESALLSGRGGIIRKK